MPKKIFQLLLIDYIFASISWAIFYFYRKEYIEHSQLNVDDNFYLGIFLIPIFWIILYTLQGTYLNIRYMYRTKILAYTFFGSLLGSIILFFFFILDDHIIVYTNYYKSFFILFFIHFFINALSRGIYFTIYVKNIHNGKYGFRTLIIGEIQSIENIYIEILDSKLKSIKVIGYLAEEKNKTLDLSYLGSIENVFNLVKEHKIEEVILSFDQKPENIQHLISQLIGLGVVIKEKPNMNDIISGNVKTTNIYGALFNELNSYQMPVWQRVIKRFLDITLSLFALIILFPVFIVLAILVKAGSKGPIFFTQERIGLNGKPFQIIKFRTMYVNAEKAGPQLSSENDPRITKIGKFMRKTRFDEFPQFYNVVIGDMSLVGPRPERQFYIDQIVSRNPQYLELNVVRPGITSWGQVKFGYAENVDEMLQRMKFDLLYLKNISLALDFKIMLYTVLIMIKAKGK